ncbi:signal transduction histidine kinase [Flavobacterium sp. 90]|uniref:sensor histidine kinase n=1 Tax=unclassified Flavobacterium TaxID=196869 RepID=UPI000EAFF12D|nr:MULTISPECIES: HAMP domain-containing sensor histidine kinase [unclassified Flavobacterium]RKR05535.1 signal transduction histidine kinase [Flavobacterium sp. 81]TCK56850.1 signal transduction histidine kinase [Flavobacterium sp. 90]
MKTRTRLTILFTLITATILLVFAGIILISAKQNREKEFYTLLKKEAVTKANLFFNAKVNSKTLQDIYRNNRATLNEVEVAIYTTSFRLLYHDAVDIDVVKETKPMIDEIALKSEIQFYQNDWQVIGMKYKFQGKEYVITAAAYDGFGYIKLNNLLKTCIIVFIISILLLYIAGRFFSKKAFEPIVKMTSKAKNISATNLDLRLDTNQSKDEISELASTFNTVLNRLENSFDSQKQFVSNISHELRTPLSAIITELELSTNKERNNEEYKVVISNTLQDAKKIAKLSNSLLDLAKANYDPSEIAFKQVRIDEILLDAQQQVQKSNPNYNIAIHFENDFEDEDQITINGNEYLLKVAFVNLFENGCKFSENKQSKVIIRLEKEQIILEFVDKGIGISEEDLKQIFKPFYRGSNKLYADGNGIGLSLTQKIILLHKGTIAITSDKKSGTIFTVSLIMS